MQKLVEKLGLSEGATSAVLWVGLSVLLLVVVALLALWLVRTLRPSLNINGAGRGGRPQRLAITDAFPLDRDGRKLVIVRRDNTEHLLLIGGPNDLLVEGNITRHDRSARGLNRTDAEGEDIAGIPAPMQAPPAPAPAPLSPPLRTDDFERALANQRPLATPPTLAPRPAPSPYTPPAPPPVQTPAPVMAPVVAPVVAAPVMPPPPAPAPPPALAPAPAPAPAPEPPRREPPPAPPVLTLESLLPEAVPVASPEPPAAPAPRAPAMSEMARRLNEALQKPMSGTLRPPFNRSIPPAPPTSAASTTPGPVTTPVAPPAPAAPEPAPLPPAPAPEPAARAPENELVAKADMDLLEEEMARLLGRPAQPKKPDAS